MSARGQEIEIGNAVFDQFEAGITAIEQRRR
jgi:hypothetical protein